MATKRGGAGTSFLGLAAAFLVAGAADAPIGERVVEGVVRADASGAPLAGARVEVAVRPRGGRGALSLAAVESDARGRFAVATPPGSEPVGLVARLAGHAVATRALTAASGVARIPVEVFLRRGGTLRVRLVAAGASSASAIASGAVEAALSDRALSLPLFFPLDEVIPGGGGVHAAELEPGAYAVVARAPGRALEVLLDVAVEAGKTVERTIALRPAPAPEPPRKARKARCGPE